MNNLHILAPSLLLACHAPIFEKAQVSLLSIELFRRLDRGKMTVSWDAKMCKLFMRGSLGYPS